MKSLCVLIVLFGYASAVDPWNRHTNVEKWYRGNMQGLTAILSIPQMPERYLTGNESFYPNLKPDYSPLKFSYTNCGQSSDPVTVKSLAISPDPVVIPGTVTLSFDITSDVNITAPFEIDLDLQKKVAFWWVQIPCIDSAGSCTYNDFCSMLPATCPVSFRKYNIPCNCPALKGEYNLPSGSIDIPTLPLPSWLTSGDYWAQITGKMAGAELFCYQVYISLD